jgi:preprotein translocase subunit SecG
MGAIGIILLVTFVIVCILLVLVILVQDDGSSGMGGLLGGRGTSAFGSHSASVLTRTTFILVVLFFILSLSLALLNKKPKLQRDLAPVDTTAVEESAPENQSADWWKNTDAENKDTAGANSTTSGTESTTTNGGQN